MNIFKFTVHITSKKQIADIKKSIINCYSEKSKRNSDYKSYCENQWRNLDKEQIKALYSEKSILAYSNISNCHYYLVEVDENDSIDHLSLEVFIISEVDDITNTLNHVFNDMKMKLKKFKIETIDKKALLFIYTGKDIISTEFMIKADIIQFSGFNIKEMFRVAGIILIALVSFVIAIKAKDITVKNVSYSMIAASFFFLLTEFLMKISIKREIKIKDFSKWIEKKDKVMSSFQELNNEQSLESPEV